MKFLPQIWRKVLVACAVMWLAAAGAFAEGTLTGEYAGVIDPDLKIHMSLEEHEGKVTGWYYYDSYHIKLPIQGLIVEKVDEGVAFKLFEYDENGSNTGIFVGILENGRMTGTWKRPNGTSERSFRADRF